MWSKQVLGEPTDVWLKRIDRLIAKQDESIDKFEHEFSLSYLDVSFFGFRRHFHLYEDADVIFPQSGDQLRNALVIAKSIYDAKLHIDIVVAIIYKRIYLGYSDAVVNAANSLAPVVQLLSARIKKFKDFYGVSYYDVPLFGFDLGVLEGKFQPEEEHDESKDEQVASVKKE